MNRFLCSCRLPRGLPGRLFQSAGVPLIAAPSDPFFFSRASRAGEILFEKLG